MAKQVYGADLNDPDGNHNVEAWQEYQDMLGNLKEPGVGPVLDYSHEKPAWRYMPEYKALPTTPAVRESFPLYDYMFGYFPDAWLEEVRVSWVGNGQHNPGEPMHWARGKSMDHKNKFFRHVWDHARGVKKDEDGTWHLAKAIWRLKAWLQEEIEEERRKNDDESKQI